MSSFEYVMVIVAIIMGFGLTTLLRGAVEAVRTDSGITPGLLHSIWVGVLVLAHVWLWANRWNGERREEWPATVLLAFLVMPVLLYAQSELLFPRRTRNVRLTDYFMENRKPFFILMMLQGISTALGPYIFYGGFTQLGAPGWTPVGALAVSAGLVAVSLAMIRSSNLRLHTFVAAGWAVFMLVSLGFSGVG